MLVGKMFQPAVHAGAALKTMVLQLYEVDLLKNMSTGGSIEDEAFSELRRATDLSLCATRQMAHDIGHSNGVLVTTEMHL